MKPAAEHWNIEELEEFFKETKLPDSPVILPGTTMKIVNVKKFLDSHLSAVRAHNGNKSYRGDYERLLLFKKYIEQHK
jgi:hypothetical protein